MLDLVERRGPDAHHPRLCPVRGGRGTDVAWALLLVQCDRRPGVGGALFACSPLRNAAWHGSAIVVQ